MYKLHIVDDEELVRNGLMKTVDWAAMGFEVTNTASNGEKELLAMRSDRPDVLLTDIRMPRMDGIELMQRVVEEFPEVRIVVISGYSEFEFAQKAIEYGAMGYVLKPTRLDELEKLFTRVREALDREAAGKRAGGGRPAGLPNRRAVTGLAADAIRCIEEDFSREVNLKSVAEHLHICPEHLSRLFKKQVGDTFINYLTGVRIRNACELISNHPEMRAYEISERCGFEQPKYFGSVFKEKMGMNIGEYRTRVLAGEKPACPPDQK